MSQPYKLLRLADLVERVESGVSVRSHDQPAGQGAKGVLKVSAVFGGRFDPAENKRIRADDLSRASTHPVAGCTLVSRANTLTLVGEVGFVEQSRTDVYLPDKLWQLHPKRDVVDPFWFSLLLDSPLVRDSARLHATGTSQSMKNISQSAYLRTEVPVPPLDEQRRIASALKMLRRAGTDTGALLDAKRVFKRTLLHDLLTGRRRFPEFASEEWDIVPLSAVVTSRAGKTPSRQAPEYWNGTTPWITAKDLKTLRLRDSEDRVTDAALRGGSPLAQPGDVLILVRGMSLLKRVPVGLVESPLTFNQDVRLLRPAASLQGDFLAYSLLLAEERVLAMVSHAGHGTGRLELERLMALEINLPSLAEQRRIAQVLSAAEREIELLESLRDAYEAQKRAIVHRLLCGDLQLSAPATAPELAHA